MIRKFVLLTIMAFGVVNAFADTDGEDTLYTRLDNAIARSFEYVNVHEKFINKLRSSYFKAKSDKQKYDMAMSLYVNYKSFVNDSAFAYLKRCMETAHNMKRNDLYMNSIALMALQCSTTGMYVETLSLLEKVRPKELDRKGLHNYYMAYTHVYHELGAYTLLKSLRSNYMDKAGKYSDSMYVVSDKNSEDYLLRKELNAFDSKDYAAALAMNDIRMKKTNRYSRNYAIVAYYRSQIYRALKNMRMAKYWLVESAVSDIYNAIMDQGSLWNLASLLDKEGNTERSYRYIKFTTECSNRFNTRMRNWQIAPVLSLIDNNYQKQMVQTNRELKVFIFVISLLVILLLCLLFFVYVQNKRLSAARLKHKQANEKLKVLNERFDEYNKQLAFTNNKLVASNVILNETNRIKEEYIGRFLSICSRYVDKLNDYRMHVNRMIKNKEIDKLYKNNKSSELKDKELDELYNNFDIAFLNLFPNFIDDFNALLRPDKRIYPAKQRQLNTDLRIFALIRLGIEDSCKISEFLHYSVNTIYNYRSRIKNYALSDRECFEQKVKDIGMNG